MKGATYAGWTGSGWSSSSGAHDLENIAYDASGNLSALQRRRETGSLVDNLSYATASGSNRLSSLTDAVSGNAETWDARTGSFTYDANGNLLTSGAPYSITAATYDHRNLPLTLQRGGTTTTYRYDHAEARERALSPHLHDVPGQGYHLLLHHSRATAGLNAIIMKKREDVRVRVVPLRDAGSRSDLAGLTPGERMELMWQLAVDAWTFKGEPERAESRLQRHVVRIARGGS